MKLAVAVACCLLALMVAGKRVVNQVLVASRQLLLPIVGSNFKMATATTIAKQQQRAATRRTFITIN